MINRERLKKQLKQDEGYVKIARKLKVKDKQGNEITEDFFTDGYGNKYEKGEVPPKFSTDEEAKAYHEKKFDENLDEALQQAVSIIGANHPPEVLEAVTNMTFNMGKEGVKGFDLTIKMLKKRDYRGASKEILLSSDGKSKSGYYNQVGGRAERVSKLMSSGFKTDDAGPVGEMFREIDMAQYLGRRL